MDFPLALTIALSFPLQLTPAIGNYLHLPLLASSSLQQLMNTGSPELCRLPPRRRFFGVAVAAAVTEAREPLVQFCRYVRNNNNKSQYAFSNQAGNKYAPSYGSVQFSSVQFSSECAHTFHTFHLILFVYCVPSLPPSSPAILAGSPTNTTNATDTNVLRPPLRSPVCVYVCACTFQCVCVAFK